jgi:hypothetical protein
MAVDELHSLNPLGLGWNEEGTLGPFPSVVVEAKLQIALFASHNSFEFLFCLLI